MSNIREAAAREIAALNKHAADREHRDRRERIATAALAGILADPTNEGCEAVYLASWAVEVADALIAELDKKEGGT